MSDAARDTRVVTVDNTKSLSGIGNLRPAPSGSQTGTGTGTVQQGGTGTSQQGGSNQGKKG